MRKRLIIIGALLVVVMLVLGACAPTPQVVAPPTPAAFEVISLDIKPQEVVAGETVTVTVVVKNIGGSEGTYAAILTVDGVFLETKEVALTPGSSTVVTFSLVKDTPGTYEISIGELSATLTIKEKVVAPPTPAEVITNDTWTISGDIYLLASRGAGHRIYREIIGTHSLLGGSIDYIYQEISLYWNAIRQSNTLILFNATAESLSVLGDWPEQYKKVYPFTVNELGKIELPFALLKRQDDGLIRAIIIANSESKIIEFVTIMANRKVPVSTPWTLRDGEIVASQIGDVWFEAPKELSDATLAPTQTPTESELAELRSQIATLKGGLSAKEAAIQELQKQVDEKSKRIRELEDTVARLEKALEGATSPPVSIPQQTHTLENEHFVIHYFTGCEEDARETLDSAMWVREQTMKMYPHHLGFKVNIYLYHTPEGWAPLVAAVARTDSSSAAIAIRCPSWEGHWGGYEQLDNPFRRVLNHEYVHAAFYKDLFSKSAGYGDQPSWFSQGIAEYISGNYLPSYEKWVREAVQRGSFVIDEPYSWGLYIVEYMYQEYGQEKIVNLVKSTAPTFEDALSKELGVSPSEFEDGWRAHLAEKFGDE